MSDKVAETRTYPSNAAGVTIIFCDNIKSTTEVIGSSDDTRFNIELICIICMRKMHNKSQNNITDIEKSNNLWQTNLTYTICHLQLALPC